MYGQFQNQFSLNKKLSHSAPANEDFQFPFKNKKFFLFILLLLSMITFSAVSFAGPSQPKIRGGNGNAQGR
jgi:hypothetical protein